MLILPGRGARGQRPSGPVVLNRQSVHSQWLDDLFLPLSLDASGRDFGRYRVVREVRGTAPSFQPSPWPLGSAFRSVSGGCYSYGGNPTDTYQTNFTIAFWFRTRDTAQTNKYLLERDRNGLSIIYGYVANSIEVFSTFYTGSDPRTGSQITVDDTLWHHIAYTYDGSTWAGYKDGQQVFSTARTFSMPNTASARINIGNNDDLNANPDVELAHVLMRPVAMPAAAIWQLWEPNTRWDLYWVPGRTLYLDLAAGGGGGSTRRFLSLLGVGP